MPVSANTLFHFTDSFEKLIGILKEEFKPQYCAEHALEDLLYKEESWSVVHFVPMVCFCDLPLSSIAEHVKEYGKYAIGMSKQWGINQGLNPVMYLSRKSNLVFSLKEVVKNCDKNIFGKVEAYIKLYENQGKKKRFYDEREWRYVPKTDSGQINFITAEVYGSPKKRAKANEYIAQHYKLSFEPRDIKYIVIKSETERLKIIEAIRDAKYKYPNEIVTVLSSRVLSSEQIKEDF